jgi:hypothetical protein
VCTHTHLAQAADTAAIRAAITEEARRRGIEHTLKEERPPAARRGAPGGALALSDELLRGAPDELIQFLQRALDGQLPPGLRLSSSGGGSGGEQQQQQQHGEDEDEDEEEEEDDEEEEEEGLGEWPATLAQEGVVVVVL